VAFTVKASRGRGTAVVPGTGIKRKGLAVMVDALPESARAELDDPFRS
jgi:hypothetical protein